MTETKHDAEARELLAAHLDAHHFQTRAERVRRNEHTELPSHDEAVAAISEALARAERAEGERDEADRRAGAAGREVGYLKEDAAKSASWRRDAKKARGYDDGVSFDIVWSETCASADKWVGRDLPPDLSAVVERLTAVAKDGELGVQVARRLSSVYSNPPDGRSFTGLWHDDVAALLSATASLRSRISEAEAVIAPFAKACPQSEAFDTDDLYETPAATQITYGDLRRAAAFKAEG